MYICALRCVYICVPFFNCIFKPHLWWGLKLRSTFSSQSSNLNPPILHVIILERDVLPYTAMRRAIAAGSIRRTLHGWRHHDHVWGLMRPEAEETILSPSSSIPTLLSMAMGLGDNFQGAEQTKQTQKQTTNEKNKTWWTCRAFPIEHRARNYGEA